MLPYFPASTNELSMFSNLFINQRSFTSCHLKKKNYNFHVLLLLSYFGIMHSRAVRNQWTNSFWNSLRTYAFRSLCAYIILFVLILYFSPVNQRETVLGFHSPPKKEWGSTCCQELGEWALESNRSGFKFWWNLPFSSCVTLTKLPSLCEL